MEVKFQHQGADVVKWQVGEQIVLRVTAVDGDTYTADTADTFPADIRERHQAALGELSAAHVAHLRDLGVGVLEEDAGSGPADS